MSLSKYFIHTLCMLLVIMHSGLSADAWLLELSVWFCFLLFLLQRPPLRKTERRPVVLRPAFSPTDVLTDPHKASFN